MVALIRAPCSNTCFLGHAGSPREVLRASIPNCRDLPALEELPDLNHQVGGRKPLFPAQHRTEWSQAAAELRGLVAEKRSRGRDMGRAGQSWEASQDPQFSLDSQRKKESITLSPGSLAHPNLAWW